MNKAWSVIFFFNPVFENLVLSKVEPFYLARILTQSLFVIILNFTLCKLQKPAPLMEVPPPPKFDLEASNFPPLPGSVVSPKEETTPEMRLSDVVRGLKVTNKVSALSSLITPSGVSQFLLQLCKCTTSINQSIFLQSTSQEAHETQHTNTAEKEVKKVDSGTPVAKPAPVTPHTEVAPPAPR